MHGNETGLYVYTRTATGTAKIRFRNFFLLFVKHNRISSKREICFREKLLILAVGHVLAVLAVSIHPLNLFVKKKLRDLRKLCASKICRYTVYSPVLTKSWSCNLQFVI